jgi:DnaJ family protein C protein 28
VENEKDWNGIIEDRIRQAMERGEFDNLRGKGKPLDLERNPWAGDWELAFHVLENAGFAPEWIERDKAIRAELAALRKLLDDHVAWHRSTLAILGTAPTDEIQQHHAKLEHARAQTVAVYRTRAAALNKQIDVFNLTVPSVQLQRHRIAIDEEIQKFEQALIDPSPSPQPSPRGRRSG